MSELPADVEAIKLQLLTGVGRTLQRRKGRKRLLRIALISVGAAMALSASALAAGDALGVIDLGGGVQAARVAGYPAYDVQTKTMVLAGADQYVYDITGVRSPSCLGPGYVYITSTLALSPDELRTAYEAADGTHPRLAPSAIRGLTSLAAGCGDAGIEAIVDRKPPAHSSLPAPVVLYGDGAPVTAAPSRAQQRRRR